MLQYESQMSSTACYNKHKESNNHNYSSINEDALISADTWYMFLKMGSTGHAVLHPHYLNCWSSHWYSCPGQVLLQMTFALHHHYCHGSDDSVDQQMTTLASPDSVTAEIKTVVSRGH
jgi:hypothetical protein